MLGNDNLTLVFFFAMFIMMVFYFLYVGILTYLKVSHSFSSYGRFAFVSFSEPSHLPSAPVADLMFPFKKSQGEPLSPVAN